MPRIEFLNWIVKFPKSGVIVVEDNDAVTMEDRPEVRQEVDEKVWQALYQLMNLHKEYRRLVSG